MRVLCRLGCHAWKKPGQWITYRDGVGGVTHVVGKQRCGRGGCVAVRDFHKTWAAKNA